MPVNQEMLSRINLVAELDKKSLNDTRTTLQRMMKDAGKLGLNASEVEKYADQIKNTLRDVGPDLSSVVKGTFDRQTGEILKQLMDVRADIMQAGTMDAADAAPVLEALLEQQNSIEKQLDLELRRLKAQKEWVKATRPNLKVIEETTSQLGASFLSTLNQAKSGDLTGLAEGFLGAMSKGAGKVGGALKMGSEAAGVGTGTGAAMGTLSAGMVAVGAGMAAVAAAVGALLAVMVMADEQAKDFNKAMLEGAGAADFTFGKGAKAADQMNMTMAAGQKAAIEMAWRWRGQAKDFADMLGHFNQAGMSFKEMTKGAKTQEEAHERLVAHMQTATVLSKSLGLSVGETTEAMATWSADFGGSLEEMEKRFASVAGAAQASGMNTKRFFTTVSQATAGMALYNNRVEDAAALLSKTSKILGETDASNFIQTLTKGFADESYVDRFKRIMISGTEDVRKIMVKDSMKMARDFSRTFKDNAQVKQVFDKIGVDLTNPEALKEKMGKMTKEEVNTLVRTLRENGEDAAARQIENTSRLIKSSQGGVTEMAKAMDELSMGGKLAMKMQGLGNKRISEMTGIELAAFEQYSGIGGEQLEQLRKMDAALIGEWDAISSMSEQVAKGDITQEKANEYLKQYNVSVDKQGRILDAQGDSLKDVDEYTMASQSKLEDIASIQDEAMYFAQTQTKATESILNYLQTGLAHVLNSIYDIMMQFYNAYMGVSPAVAAEQARLLELNAKEQSGIREVIEEQQQKLAKARQELATKGATGDAKDKAEKEISAIEAYIREKQGTLKEAETAQKNIAAGKDVDVLKAKYQNQGIGGALVSGFSYVGAALGKDTQVAQDLKVLQESQAKSKAANEQMAMDLTQANAVAEDALSVSESEAREDKKFRDRGAEKAVAEGTKEAMREMKAQELAGKLGYTGEEQEKVAQMLMSGKVNSIVQSKIRANASLADDAAYFGMGATGPVAQDFVMRPGQPPQRFSPNDTVLGLKPGGPLAGGSGNNQTVNININGGDTAQIYQTVKDALKNSGLR